MRILLAMIAVLGALNVHAAPASEESIERLLVLTKVESMMESLYPGMEKNIQDGLQQALQGKPLSPAQQRVLDTVPGKLVAMMRKEMSWEKMKPLYVHLYRETFEQEEVDGMLVFYASPAGQAAINKMPVLMQKSMALSQSMMRSFMPKMFTIMEDALKEVGISNKE
jgi:hypothetical protein